jgi:hypothetical protein
MLAKQPQRGSLRAPQNPPWTSPDVDAGHPQPPIEPALTDQAGTHVRPSPLPAVCRTRVHPDPGITDDEVVQEPTEQPYGIRDRAFRGPAGNLIRIQENR